MLNMPRWKAAFETSFIRETVSSQEIIEERSIRIVERVDSEESKSELDEEINVEYKPIVPYTSMFIFGTNNM